ncbi:MAG: indole-3-glycerol phosphate synthase TrpC [Candidatus Omnitrophica bacterium]|nr:indole-3-glycerol phosphate synthase TrpC [Candidatus Omnitrophota bacterium]
MKKTDTLKEITAKKRERLASAKLAVPEEQLKSAIAGLAPARPFLEAISKPKSIALIAELKRNSPSAGRLRADLDPPALAAQYQEAGVQAISVLTEEDFFGGSLADLAAVKNSVVVPVLRKDFILEPYQILESRAAGADAVLLISDILTKDQLAEFITLSDILGMDCLVEAHDEKELKKLLSLKVAPPEAAVAPGAPVPSAKAKKRKQIDFALGINNRDLHTLEVDPRTTEKLYPLVPKDRTVVVESGIKTYQDVLFLKILGANAVLVGESILKEGDVKTAIQELMGW